MRERIEALRAVLATSDVDALFVTSAANRRYLSGFSGSNAALLIGVETALLCTDFRYWLQAAEQAPAFTLGKITPDSQLPQLLAEAAVEAGISRLGFEATHVSVAFHRQLIDAFAELDGAPELVPVQGVVEGLREVKDAAELAVLRRAIAITDAALAAVLPVLQPEHTELQAAWMLEVAMRERGAAGISFPIIVAAGPNAALPHYQPRDLPLGHDRPIVIDMGARVDSYHADLTRTVVLGTPDDRFRQVYATVLAAQQQAIAGLRPGMTTAAADALARSFITEAGYGDFFAHGLGHGVGLEIHEGPGLRRAAAGQKDQSPRLRAGNVFSVEPGIYLAGWGGVRIEDLVLLTDDGSEVLSQAPK